MLKIGISGINGRVGQELVKEINKSNDCLTTVGFSKSMGEFNNIKITNDASEFLNLCDFVIDFSSRDALFIILEENLHHKKTVISGTTGFSEDDIKKIIEFSKNMKIFLSSNMSYGIIVIKNLIKKATQFLDDAEIEISEEHHNKKKDSPSGTALMLAKAIQEVSKEKREHKYDRNCGRASKTELGFSVKRAGNIIGNHDVSFYFDDQMVGISHKAFNRGIFARGAIKIAKKIYSLEESAGFFSEDNLFS